MCVCGMSLKTDSSSTSTRLNCGCQCLSIVVVSLHPAVLIFSPQGGYLKLANRSQHLEKRLIWPRRISLYCVGACGDIDKGANVGYYQLLRRNWFTWLARPQAYERSGAAEQSEKWCRKTRKTWIANTPSISGHHDQSDIILQTCFQLMQLIRVILGRTVPTGSPASTYWSDKSYCTHLPCPGKRSDQADRWSVWNACESIPRLTYTLQKQTKDIFIELINWSSTPVQLP